MTNVVIHLFTAFKRFDLSNCKDAFNYFIKTYFMITSIYVIKCELLTRILNVNKFAFFFIAFARPIHGNL